MQGTNFALLCSFYFIITLVVVVSEEIQPIVEISTGKLVGKVLKSRNGKNYNAFLGIPYGKAERFEVAVSPRPWDGIYNATEFGAECIQLDSISNIVGGEEDCLFLNVYTTMLQDEENGKYAHPNPVMVWLHGGGFSFGSANNFSAKYFSDEPVVLVTLNYRLGPFGFLDTQDSVISANLGLRDQYLALQWVQRNIGMFGGNPYKVTLFGSSAGAASVALHMLTDAPALFHAAISTSSTALSAWLIQRNPKENARKLGRFLDCSFQTSNDLIGCLKSKSDSEIVNGMAQFKLGSTVSDVNFIFTPSVESPLSKDPYLKHCPEKLLMEAKFSSKIPWMVGFNKHDGIFNIGSILEKKFLINEIMKNWTEIAPWIFVYNFDANGSQRDNISLKLKEKFLLPNGNIDEENFFKILSQMVGDRWEVSGTVKSMQILRGKTPIYPFIFSYVGNFSFTNQFFGLKQRHGIGHLDELQYLFDGVYGGPHYNEENNLRQFSQELVKLWVEFARTGVPSTTTFKGWNSIERDESMAFYNIDEPDGTNTPKYIEFNDDFKKRIAFWEKIAPPTCVAHWDFAHQVHNEL